MDIVPKAQGDLLTAVAMMAREFVRVSLSASLNESVTLIMFAT